MIARKVSGQTINKKYGYVATNLRIRKNGPGSVTYVLSAPISNGTIKTVCRDTGPECEALVIAEAFTEKRPFSKSDNYDSNDYPIWIQERYGLYMLKHYLPRAFDPTDKEAIIKKGLSANEVLEYLRKVLTNNSYILR